MSKCEEHTKHSTLDVHKVREDSRIDSDAQLPLGVEFRKMSNIILNYLLPPSCLQCSALIADHDGLCHECWILSYFVTKPYCAICGKIMAVEIEEYMECAQCTRSHPVFSLARSVLIFNHANKALIHQFKYYDRTGVGKFFARILFQKYKEEVKDLDLIIPVPMNFFKRLIRLYNPPSVLAHELNKMFKKKVLHNLLIKYKIGKSQVGLNKQQRQENAQNTIIFNTKYDIRNKVILLVDDVLTTGATAKTCSRILMEAGAKKVYIFTIARV
ncbi:ComF family protein [Rickettsiales endosymbiont of Paramecium tredecaurelia]|nr:ComF family protein [Candidatus Sarmatiella mevalonica]